MPQPFLFTGQEYDAESGNYHYNARCYDPNSGTFLQEDPIWFDAGDLNTYRYVFNNPQNWVDPSGMFGFGKGKGGAAGGGGKGTCKCRGGCRQPVAFLQMEMDPCGGSDQRGNMPGGAAAEYACMILWSAAALVTTLPQAVGGMRGTFLTNGDAHADARGGSSFVAGTEVVTPDGERPIESLRRGDIVIARDERTGASRSQRVTNVMKRIAPAVLWLTLAAPVEAAPGRSPWPRLAKLRAETMVFAAQRLEVTAAGP